MNETTACAYELGVDLRIVGVDARWSEFAAANHAPELVPPPGPLGQSALACVADATSALMYERLFQRVLDTNAPVSIPIRCDAPARRRYLNLTIAPRRPAGLRIETTVTRTEERSPVALLGRGTPRGDEFVRMCGWCKSVDVAGHWTEVEDALAELRLFEREFLPQVTHGMCPQCYARVSQEIDRI